MTLNSNAQIAIVFGLISILINAFNLGVVLLLREKKASTDAETGVHSRNMLNNISVPTMGAAETLPLGEEFPGISRPLDDSEEFNKKAIELRVTLAICFTSIKHTTRTLNDTPFATLTSLTKRTVSKENDPPALSADIA